MSLVHYFFHWYDGAVWSNLLASALWALPSIVWLDKRHKKRHNELMQQHIMHHLQLKKRLEKLGVGDGKGLL